MIDEMPIFTGTPSETAPASPFLWGNIFVGGSGPYASGGNIYIPGMTQSPDVAGDQGIAKSADGGVTWSVFYSGITGQGDFLNAVLDSANNQIVFLILDNSSGAQFNIFTFDLGSETFSAITDSLNFGGAGVTDDQAQLVIRPNGDLLVIYALDNATGLWFVPITGGAFGIPVLIDPVDGSEEFEARAAVSDSTGNIHIAYRHSSPVELLYNTVDSGNTPGMRQVINPAGDPYDSYFLNTAIVANGQIIFVDQFTQPARFYYGTPTATPTWTKVDLHSSIPGLTDNEACVAVSGANLRFLYQQKGTGVLQIMEVDWNGSTVTAPQVYWDILLNPPPGAIGIDPALQDTEAISATCVLGTTLAVCVTTNIDTGGTNKCIVVAGSACAIGSSSGYRNRFY